MVWYGWVKRGSAGRARLGQAQIGRVMRCAALQEWSRIARQSGDRLGWLCSARHGVQCRAMHG